MKLQFFLAPLALLFGSCASVGGSDRTSSQGSAMSPSQETVWVVEAAGSG